MEDVYCYSVENVRWQVDAAAGTLGVHEVRFYAEHGRPSRTPTDAVETFFYYPSGGTLRDRDRNIILYEPKLDTYHSSNR